MKTYKELLAETFKIDLKLEMFLSKMKRYSHNKNSAGFLDKEENLGLSFLALHKHLLHAGYKLQKKTESDQTYYTYHKTPAPIMMNLLT